ncbi:MAG: GNAT family N-acetyltransferase [Clostridia bacterium]|nr:GNAT family N-acetyltransferase [Clostridia bacterium]
MSTITLRIARPSDAAALIDIYAPYVLTTAITYEYEVPSVENFTARIQKTLQTYPYIVAERDGELLGYAYLSTYIGRAACAWSAEASIYLRSDAHGLGLGRRLYTALESVARAQNLCNLNAAIAYPTDGVEDDHLTRNSVDFHAHMGYTMVGEFHGCGFKFGRWYSLVWMEKHLCDHSNDAPPAPVIPFPQLPEAEVERILCEGKLF